MSLLTQYANDVRAAAVRARQARDVLKRGQFQLDQSRARLLTVHSGTNNPFARAAFLRCGLALANVALGLQKLAQAEEALLSYLRICAALASGDERAQILQDLRDLAERTAETVLSFTGHEQELTPGTTFPVPTISEAPSVPAPSPDQVIGQLALSITLITISCAAKAVQIIHDRKK